MRAHVAVVAVLAWSLILACASGQGVMLKPRDFAPPIAPPGCLPLEDPGEAAEMAGIEAQGASLPGVLATVAERDDLNMIAEVYPGTEWAGTKDVAIPGGPCGQVLAGLAEAYGYEYGTLHGAWIFRKQRPWEQPEIGPEVDEGPLSARRLVWDGARSCDVVAELTCRQARLGVVVRKLAEWRTPDLGPYFQGPTPMGMPRHVLVHPDFEQRRLFARIRDMEEPQFGQVLAACVGATISGADFVVLARCPGMAWRGALAEYEEKGPPDFEQHLRALDPAFRGVLWGHIRPQDVLLLELLRRTTVFETARLQRGIPWVGRLVELRDFAPIPFIVQEYPTVTFGFEELPHIAQLAVIACIKEADAEPDRPPHLRFDADRPDRIIVTLERSGAPAGKLGRLDCTVAYPMRDGTTMVI